MLTCEPKKSSYYRLVGQTPVPCAMLNWARWLQFSDKERVVARDWLKTPRRGVYAVSTVFVGADYNFGHYLNPDGTVDDRPMLFETMVFGHPDFDCRSRRYATWAEAEAGHALVVQGLKAFYPGAKIVTETEAKAPDRLRKFWQALTQLLRRIF